MNQGESSNVKRGRGRPRKISQTVNQEGESSGVKRGCGRPRKNKLPKVGEAVQGVVEAMHDAGGYLLNVHIGNSPINFRGVVFNSGENANAPRGFDNGGSSSGGGLPEDCTHQLGNSAANANGGPFLLLTESPHLLQAAEMNLNNQ